MKKLFLALLCLLLQPGMLHAQSSLVKNGAKKLAGKSANVDAAAAARQGAISTKVANQAAQAAANAAKFSQGGSTFPGADSRVKNSLGPIKNTPGDFAKQRSIVPRSSTPKPLSDAARLRQLEKEQRALQAQAEDLKFSTELGRSVLSIPNIVLEKDPSILQQNPDVLKAYSMTIIKNNYKGKEEIFGVIASHSLYPEGSENDLEFGVTRKFKAKLVMPDGSIKFIPGEVVQVSPKSMLDISLVKFDPSVEPLLKPLEINPEPVQENEPLLSPGYANNIPKIMNRVMKENTYLSVRTEKIPMAEKDRQGFCGSPILDSNGKVRAIHTGTNDKYSFGTHASFINNLIDAYHNGGKSIYDLMLNGKVLTKLNVDEYVSAISLFDESWNMLYKQDGIGTSFDPDHWGKYSESILQRAIKSKPNARYLVFHSRAAIWDDEKGIALEEIRDPSISPGELGGPREHVYDLVDHELLWTTTGLDGEFPFMLGQEHLNGNSIK